MASCERGESSSEEKLICATSAQFLLVYLNLKFEGGKALTTNELLWGINKLEEQNTELLSLYKNAICRLLSDLEHLKALGLAEVEHSDDRYLTRATLTDLGRELAEHFTLPDVLRLAPETKKQSF